MKELFEHTPDKEKEETAENTASPTGKHIDIDDSGAGICTTEIEQSPFNFTISEGEAILDKCIVESSHMIIPDTYNGLPVTTIGDTAFFNKKKITSVILPKSIHTIGFQAFCSCHLLEEINFPEGLKIIDACAFSFCSSLKSVILPESLTTLGWSAFQFCSKIDRFHIPENVTKIECSTGNPITFCNVGKLTVSEKNKKYYSDGNCIIDRDTKTLVLGCCSSVIPKAGVKKIGKYAFAGTQISEIIIPGTIIEIGERAFCNCTLLKKVKLPRSFIKIGYDAFKYTNLTWVSRFFIFFAKQKAPVAFLLYGIRGLSANTARPDCLSDYFKTIVWDTYPMTTCNKKPKTLNIKPFYKLSLILFGRLRLFPLPL